MTDRAVRDSDVLAGPYMPAHAQAVHGATFGYRHVHYEVDRPVSCAGVLVVPGDVVVGDGGGCVVVSAALAEEVAPDALAAGR
ncbi:hypothetical protein GCM10009528_41500 [Kineococcus aurantiacus]